MWEKPEEKMKKNLGIALLVCVVAIASVPAMAARVTETELIGTWRSPEALDTYLEIAQTSTGLVMIEHHQKFDGSSIDYREKFAINTKGMIEAGTWSFQYDEKTATLATLFVGVNRVIGFHRDPS
jgi:hypothetical protein